MEIDEIKKQNINKLTGQAIESDKKYLKEIKPILISIHAAIGAIKSYAENDYQYELAKKEFDKIIESFKE